MARQGYHQNIPCGATTPPWQCL